MKRTFWAGVGYTLGLGSSFWVQRRVRRTVERYTPEQVRIDLAVRGRRVADRARDVVVDLREAAQEGAAAMRREELHLRQEFVPQAAPHRHRPARLHP
ncbi:MAG: hypothetical protein GWN79_13235 [Actinobacteria bacterium]|nr:hypothetical protein [Actinomycetota bacterium]NIS32490.1 hypothetical protein [Actinomycetota bacterium]NIT96276.1 hypothetical protein [Actinomycetota bacterium]NIU19988.1 hypothetical protein [Actinomycetota bacterium]NIU67508.1 hypothetical protein [Actinomycetota bacterium]